MAKKTFLLPLATVLSGLWQASDAAVPTEPGSQPTESVLSAIQQNSALVRNGVVETTNADYRVGEDLFRFVIKRTSDGQIFADHESHRSHSSHSSHRSHYSARY